MLPATAGLAIQVVALAISLHGRVADAFTAGLHAAFYASMGFMALAAGLSALRAGSPRSPGHKERAPACSMG